MNMKRFPARTVRPFGLLQRIFGGGGAGNALPARMVRLAVLLLAAGFVLFLAGDGDVGHAQMTDPVLVSNTGQTAGSDQATATGQDSYAQSFTTGSHPDGYFLSSVEVASRPVRESPPMWSCGGANGTCPQGTQGFPLTRVAS